MSDGDQQVQLLDEARKGRDAARILEVCNETYFAEREAKIMKVVFRLITDGKYTDAAGAAAWNQLYELDLTTKSLKRLVKAGERASKAISSKEGLS